MAAERCFDVIALEENVLVFRLKEGTLSADEMLQLLEDIRDIFKTPVHLIIDCRRLNVARSLVHITPEAVVDIKRDQCLSVTIISSSKALAITGGALIKLRNASDHVILLSDVEQCRWPLVYS